VRVETQKLDSLMEMVGEMVIAQSLVRHNPSLIVIEISDDGRGLKKAKILEKAEQNGLRHSLRYVQPAIYRKQDSNYASKNCGRVSS